MRIQHHTENIGRSNEFKRTFTIEYGTCFRGSGTKVHLAFERVAYWGHIENPNPKTDHTIGEPSTHAACAPDDEGRIGKDYARTGNAAHDFKEYGLVPNRPVTCGTCRNLPLYRSRSAKKEA